MGFGGRGRGEGSFTEQGVQGLRTGRRELGRLVWKWALKQLLLMAGGPSQQPWKTCGEGGFRDADPSAVRFGRLSQGFRLGMV